MGKNYPERTVSSFGKFTLSSCAHLCNSQEIYLLSFSQQYDKDLLVCQDGGLGLRNGKSETRSISNFYLKNNDWVVLFIKFLKPNKVGCWNSCLKRFLGTHTIVFNIICYKNISSSLKSPAWKIPLGSFLLLERKLKKVTLL